MRRFVQLFAAVLLASSSVLVLPAPQAGAITFSTRPAVWRDGVWFLRNSLTSGAADTSFHFGNPRGDFPMMCDWDGNGTRTPGVVRSGVWFITNTIPPSTVTSFPYGNPGDFPVCGDWDGNGSETPGVARGDFGGGEWFFSDSLGGNATHVFSYGDATQDFPIVGDWDNNASDTVGVFRESTGQWLLRNSNDSGVSDVAFNYGDPGDFPLVWTG